jgi:uncharacterized coiled-coil protein SlyX
VDNLDERVALLEGRITEQSMRIDDVREAVASLEARMDRRLDQLDQRFASIDQRFAGIDQRFITMDQRFVGLDSRLDQMNRLLWGVLVMVATGAVATVAGIVTALFQK